MKTKMIALVVLSFLGLALLSSCSQLNNDPTTELTIEQPKTQGKRPNILLIVADDLGYSDIASFGGEIETPNLDDLAKSGARLTNYVVAPTCSPTRSMLMSGTYNHRAGLGAMAEWVADNQKDQPGYEGYLNDKVAALPALLKDAGYRTFMAGKWHLGMEPGQGPDSKGFDDSFALLPGAGNHYSDKGLVPFLPVVPYRENGQEVKLPSDFYSTDFYTDKIIDYIGGEATGDISESKSSSDKPFFAYLAYTAPHWPLQVDSKYSDKYAGKYDGGYADIKDSRLKRMVKLGLVSEQTKAHGGDSCYPSWEQLSKEEQQRQSRMMEIYAGMVDSMDENIGRLIQHLKDTGEYENTFIVFMSDNGADARPERGLGQESAFLKENYSNVFDNLGAENSFVSYGGAWAQVGSTPFRLHKGTTTEGGIRAPAIISYPAGGYAGGIQTDLVSVMDILPTFLELAGTTHPGTSYKGRDVHPVTGKSILPYLKGLESAVHKDEPYGFSVHRRQGLSYNEWKVVRLRAPYGDGSWELFNLETDPGETLNLAESEPKVMNEMITRWAEFESTTGVIVAGPSLRTPGECAVK